MLRWEMTVSWFHSKKAHEGATHLGDDALSSWVDAVAGRRTCRDSCLRLEMPASLLNDALDLDALWLLEKLFVLADAGSNRRDHIFAVGVLRV